MDKILRNTNIWDLHIHTPLGTPTKKNYGNASTEEFIDTIIDIYNKSNNKIGMISFTDHNKINADAYELFKIKSDIAIIPGIEVDVYLSEKDKDSKHIIFYFDEEELENIRELKTLVEDYIESNEKVIFEDFIMYLVVKRKHFAVSPHAFKQGKRGIDNDWFDEERASRGANEFTGLIFPFWEAAGKTDICKAIEFLNEQYNDEYNNQSVIAFSDSADYKKLQNYINNPHQYFRCLNSFKGLLLAGSDPDRIIYENENRPLCNPSEKIKSIRLSNDLREIKKNNVIEIEFSDRLNAIVGGRGKGKSALLDAIVYALNENEIENRTRRDFVKKFHVEITNFNDGLMPSDVKFLYFSQSYISKLFDGESQSRLESFFKKEFAHNSDVTDGTSDLHAKMEKSILCDVIEDININDEFSNFTYAHGKSTYLNVRKIREKKILLVYNQESYYDAIKNVLPEDKEIWDDQLLGELKSFSDLLVEKICIANEPIAKLNLLTRTLSINRSHPYVANYMDSNSNIIPLESMVITEVLTESHLYELSLDESMVNEIIKRRDSTLRQLALSDKMGIPTAAMFLKDSLDNPSGLEEAVARVLTVFGFEVTPIGGNGEPDGKAEACLGFSEEGKNKSYSLTYDAKSTAKNKIAAATAHLSGLRRHREAYNADFSLEVAVDYQGAEDELSAISVEAKNEKVTMMTAKDLIKLLLLITPKQIGLDKLRELFETCYMPQDVHEWIENIEKTEVEKPPYYELVDVVYELQKTDSEAPELGTIRYKLKEKMNKNYSKMQVREWLVLLSNLIPGCVTIDGNYVGVQASAQIIKERIHKAINDMPLGYKPLYDEIFK